MKRHAKTPHILSPPLNFTKSTEGLAAATVGMAHDASYECVVAWVERVRPELNTANPSQNQHEKRKHGRRVPSLSVKRFFSTDLEICQPHRVGYSCLHSGRWAYIGMKSSARPTCSPPHHSNKLCQTWSDAPVALGNHRGPSRWLLRFTFSRLHTRAPCRKEVFISRQSLPV